MFWPDKQEFIRMAVKSGATIIPFGVVGEDEISEVRTHLYPLRMYSIFENKQASFLHHIQYKLFKLLALLIEFIAS